MSQQKIDKAFISSIVSNPEKALKTLTEDNLAEIIQYANYQYYNTDKPAMPDNIYDIVKEHLEKLNPDNPILTHIGAIIDDKDERKAKLPFWMGSMDKIKSDEAVIEKWKSSYPSGDIVISDKLDGNSALIHWHNHEAVLYTRGNGKEGQNITHLIPFIKGIPDLSNFTKYRELAVRGEIIISKEDFKKVAHLGANGRNMVAGVLNAKKPNLQVVKVSQFVAYEMVTPRAKPSVQFDTLNSIGFNTAHYSEMSVPNMSAESLSSILSERRSSSEFEIDGIIVCHNSEHPLLTKGNPKYAFAFKSMLMMDRAEVIVMGVEWNISKDGYIKPVVIIEPVKLVGVVIKRVTGFNGKFIKDNRIGPGAKIVITRSGDVIPHIVEVVQKAETPSMPDNITYKWTNSGIDIVVDASNSSANKEIRFKEMEFFFTKLKTTGVSTGVVRKFFDAGYDNVGKVVSATLEDVSKIPAFKGKLGEKVVASIKNTFDNADMISLMEASNQFGRGVGGKKLAVVANVYPEFLHFKKPVIKTQDLVVLDGIEMKTAIQVVKGLDAWHEWIKANSLDAAILAKSKHQIQEAAKPQPQNKNGQQFTGKGFLFTGVRSKPVEEFIVASGGVIKSSMSKNVNVLICKDPTGTSSKLQEARKMGIEIVSLDAFAKKHNISI